MSANYKDILENAKTILLVDWPNPGVPRALLKAGFTVFCYSPDHYSVAAVVDHLPENIDSKNVFPPVDINEEGYLVFKKLDNRLDSVDIVNVYRPEGEHAGIITNHVLPLNAKVLWLHPPVKSEITAALAEEYGLEFVEGVDIADVAKSISGN